MGRRRIRDVRGRNIRSVTVPRRHRGGFKIVVIAHTARGGRIVTRRTYGACTKTHPTTHVFPARVH
jgi:hypothetical protein